MKKFKFLTVMLAFMVFLGSFTACKPAEYELNIMSFNIRWPTVEDKEYRDWDVRKRHSFPFSTIRART